MPHKYDRIEFSTSRIIIPSGKDPNTYILRILGYGIQAGAKGEVLHEVKAIGEKEIQWSLGELGEECEKVYMKMAGKSMCEMICCQTLICIVLASQRIITGTCMTLE